MTTPLPPVTVVAFLTGVGAVALITGVGVECDITASVPPPHAVNSELNIIAAHALKIFLVIFMAALLDRCVDIGVLASESERQMSSVANVLM